MSENFVLSCESTVDMPYSYVSGRSIPILFYSYSVDGVEYEDDMGKTADGLSRFYDFLAQGKLPSTSQINVYRYLDYFEELLRENDNILHIAFGSGMTPSVNNALEAAKQLEEKYPEKKITVVDSTCSSSGYGLIVDYAADMRDEGKTVAEITEWLEANKRCVHHQFYSTDMKFFKRSGRVSGVAATVATILGICPIMRLNDAGKIIAYDKVRGKAAALNRTVAETLNHIRNGKEYNGKLFISHSNCIEDAKRTAEAIENEIPALKGKIKIFNIGTIIASHSGSGTVAVFFLGDERQPEK